MEAVISTALRLPIMYLKEKGKNEGPSKSAAAKGDSQG
jgi:hypothetical protein